MCSAWSTGSPVTPSSPEAVADKILAGVRKNRFLIYTSTDIRALYTFKRVAWWPYSIAMRRANDIFTQTMPRTRSSL